MYTKSQSDVKRAYKQNICSENICIIFKMFMIIKNINVKNTIKLGVKKIIQSVKKYICVLYN